MTESKSHWNRNSKHCLYFDITVICIAKFQKHVIIIDIFCSGAGTWTRMHGPAGCVVLGVL